MVQILLCFLAAIFRIVTAITICDPQDFKPLEDDTFRQGELSSLSLYQHKRNGKVYVKKLIPKESIMETPDLETIYYAYITEVKVLDHLQSTDIVPKLFCASEDPNMTLKEYSKKDGYLFFMMEEIRGYTLYEFSRRNKDADSLRNVLKQLARGIFQLHSSDVIHLDIKPDNVLIDDQEKVKLIDFGGAYSNSLNLTHGFFHVSKSFVHPTLRSIRHGTSAMDWYSFGVTAYVSRLSQLYPGRILCNVGYQVIPEAELVDLIRICKEELNVQSSFTEIFQRIKLLPYFQGAIEDS